jgi:hypothetical protein
MQRCEDLPLAPGAGPSLSALQLPTARALQNDAALQTLARPKITDALWKD